MKTVMHLKSLQKFFIVVIFFFYQKLQVWGGTRGIYLLCFEDIDCLAPLYVPVALE